MQEGDNDAAIRRAERDNRVLAGVLFVCFAAPLVVASLLTPSDAGMGTHQQMGLPPCGFVLATGYPCATCGCTTAFAHAANGSLLDAVLTQPFGAVLALLLAMLTLVTGWAFYSGMSLSPVSEALLNKRAVLSGVALLLLSWGYKAAQVTLAAGAANAAGG